MTAPILKHAVDLNRPTAISTKPPHTQLTPSSAKSDQGHQRHRANVIHTMQSFLRDWATDSGSFARS